MFEVLKFQYESIPLHVVQSPWSGVTLFFSLFLSCQPRPWHPPLQRLLPLMSWWRLQMETFSTLLDICLGNSPVKVKHSFGHSSGMVGLMNMKRKVHQLGTGYMMWSWPMTSLMTLTLGFFKVKFRNSSISGIVDLSDVKWKGSEFTIYWANYMTFPFDHTHDLGLDHSWTWTWYWLLCYHGGVDGCTR